MSIPTVNRDSLWQAHMEMARIGPTAEGGSCRLALSAADGAARALLLDWCRPLGLAVEQDAIGNFFARRTGTGRGKAVAFGSHLDTVPTGGRFDGVSGVLAGLALVGFVMGLALWQITAVATMIGGKILGAFAPAMQRVAGILEGTFGRFEPILVAQN